MARRNKHFSPADADEDLENAGRNDDPDDEEETPESDMPDDDADEDNDLGGDGSNDDPDNDPDDPDNAPDDDMPEQGSGDAENEEDDVRQRQALMARKHFGAGVTGRRMSKAMAQGNSRGTRSNAAPDVETEGEDEVALFDSDQFMSDVQTMIEKAVSSAVRGVRAEVTQMRKSLGDIIEHIDNRLDDTDASQDAISKAVKGLPEVSKLVKALNGQVEEISKGSPAVRDRDGSSGNPMNAVDRLLAKPGNAAATRDGDGGARLKTPDVYTLIEKAENFRDDHMVQVDGLTEAIEDLEAGGGVRKSVVERLQKALA